MDEKELVKRLKEFYCEQLREDGELFVDEMEANTTDDDFAEAVKRAQKSYADWELKRE